MSRRKAVGLDGWGVAELRLLPDELLELVAALFDAVERHGRWPGPLCRPEGLLLPKGAATDPGDPMQRRPIWLLPMLYRVWAAGRAQAFAAWRASWPGGDGGLGAEQLAWELALELEAAEAAGEAVCGAALHWRKAFDNVPLGHVEPVLARAGVPERLRGPIVAAYTAPRRIRVEAALGGEWEPSSGILPGCALAVFVLSILMRPWDRRVEKSHELLRRRIYVDDLTLWARGSADDAAEAVAAGLDTTAEYEAAMSWSLNAQKSAQFANTAALRRWLSSRHPTIPATNQVKDVGVVAVAGRARRAAVPAARLLGAAGRFRRVGRLPVPFDRRCRLGAAAGTASGVYGAACGAPPARELEALRRAAEAAVCRGGFRTAAEVVFGLLSPAWGLDPKAVAVIAPVLQAARAMRQGRFPGQLWRTTAGAVGAGCGRGFGPVAATLRNLALLGLGTDVERWTGVPAAPAGWRPAEQPLHGGEQGRAARRLASRAVG